MISKPQVIKKYELLISGVILAFIFETYPLDVFSPQHLISGDTNLLNILIRFIFYGTFALLLNPWLKGFLSSSLALFQVPFLGFLLFWALISFTWSGTPDITLRASI